MFLAFGVLSFLDNTGSEKDVLMSSIDYCEFSITLVLPFIIRIPPEKRKLDLLRREDGLNE